MKASVLGLLSLRAGKLRLNEVRIELASPFEMSSRFHWPMQGPQALASTVAPMPASSAIWPSRWMVLWICSEPGETQSVHFAVAPCAAAWRATSAAREMSS